MTGTIGELFDPDAMAIVFTGTMLATAARSGWGDLWCGAKALTRIGHRKFDEDANRIALAQTASAIQRDGYLCAETPMPPDGSLARMIDAYVRHGTLEAMHTIRRADRAVREAGRARAVSVFEYAGELAPVFGLVGTLFAITRMMPDVDGSTAASLAAIATAVLSTIYGVLLAHLVCIPIAGRIERAGEREETAREELASWLDRQLRGEDVPAAARLRDVA